MPSPSPSPVTVATLTGDRADTVQQVDPESPHAAFMRARSLCAWEGLSTQKEDSMSDMQLAPPVKTRHHIKNAISLRGLSEQVKRADGINAKIAVFLTNIVGSMWCAYAFALVALVGLRPALKPGGEGLIAWIAQTFLQLVLLSVIMVGQNVQSEASDARSEHTYDDTVKILDRLDIHTQGGLRDIAELIERLEAAVKPQAT
jgi:hypothetical protein